MLRKLTNFNMYFYTDDIFDIYYNEAFINQCKKNSSIPESSPRKIHISLDFDAYLKHKQKLRLMIFDYLPRVTENQFKIVNEKLLLARLETFRHFKQLLMGFNHNQLTADEFTELSFLLEKTYQDNPSLPSVSSQFGEFMRHVEDMERTAVRFMRGDQITIYLPETVSKESLMTLIKQIQSYMKEQNIKPGRTSAIASPITSHINFRHDRLSNGKHIDATLYTTDEAKHILAQQTNDELFLFLTQKIKHPSKSAKISQSNDSFWNKDKSLVPTTPIKFERRKTI